MIKQGDSLDAHVHSLYPNSVYVCTDRTTAMGGGSNAYTVGYRDCLDATIDQIIYEPTRYTDGITLPCACMHATGKYIYTHKLLYRTRRKNS